MQYSVKLLDQSLDKTEATIFVKVDGGSVSYAINTENSKMKLHIEKVLATDYYSISPGYTSIKESTVCVLLVNPYTVEQATLIPEILGWKGYDVSIADVTKSVDYDDFIIYKSSGDIHNNHKGERIVSRVPKGMMAVSDTGKVVMGGKRLNANIDKPDAIWKLVENPYENMSSEERASEKADYSFGFNDYHPGFEDAFYVDDDDSGEAKYHKLNDEFEIPEDSLTLEEFYADSDYGVVSNQDEITSPSQIPSNLPTALKEGFILYAPKEGYAMPSSMWPPIGLKDFQNIEWFAFEVPDTNDESEIDELVESFGMAPNLIKGATKSLVKGEPGLDVSEGFKVTLSDESNLGDEDFKVVSIDVNRPLKGKTSMEDILTAENKTKIEKVRDSIEGLKEFTSYRETPTSYPGLAPGIEDMEVPDLKGGQANFQLELRPEQKPVVNAMVNKGNYEKWGGPVGQHGYYCNLIYGAGKTAIVCAADAVLRNNGSFKSGEQTTLITAPSKNIFVWQSEIAKFRAEGAYVISGAKGERISQWEALIQKAQDGELPNFVIVAASKFRLGNEVIIEDEEEKKEIDVDAQFMRLLALGGTANGKRIKGGHIGALTLDETSQYINPDSARYQAAKEISESIYYGKGITWMLNGDLSDNSATDTITQVSLMNNVIRNNMDEAIGRWTIKDASRPNSNARIWNAENGGLIDFNENFGHTIYTLDGKMIAGDEYGLTATDDMELPLGHNWGQVYNETLDKMKALSTQGTKSQNMQALGMLSLLVNTSFGAVQPARLLEYDVGTDLLMSKAKDLLSPELYEDLKEEVRSFLLSTTEDGPAGKTPKARLQVKERDDSYRHNLSDSSRQALQYIVDSWDNPTVDGIMNGIKEAIDGAEPGQPIKLGVAGFSKRAIQNLYTRLRNEYEEHSVLVQKFDGDTDSSLINDQMQAHQDEKDRHVISLVTGAGLYGLSLPADRSWRFPTWNPAKGGQYTGRFHRNPRQPHVHTVTVPRGVCEYMREVESKKKNIQNQLKAELVDIDIEDLDDDTNVKSSGSITKLIDKLELYRPDILTREKSDER